jgi:hypothetical protein
MRFLQPLPLGAVAGHCLKCRTKRSGSWLFGHTAARRALPIWWAAGFCVQLRDAAMICGKQERLSVRKALNNTYGLGGAPFCPANSMSSEKIVESTGVESAPLSDDAVIKPLQPNRDVVAKRLGEAAIVIHLSSNCIYELNETGTRVWELLCEGFDADGIVRQLVEEFEVDEARAAAEVEGLITQFRAAGLL